MTEYKELKRLAELATPQDFDSAQAAIEGGWIECPCCGGEGSVEIGINYLNYDDVAQGVQFYGVGEEHVNTEAYYRAAKPAAVLALIADRDALAAQRDEGLARENQLREERDSYQRVGIQAQQRLAEATELVRETLRQFDDNRFPGIRLMQRLREFKAASCADGEKAE